MQKNDKIISDLAVFISSFQNKNKTIVFTNGCFDLLHEGHLHLLKEAKKLGYILIVAVNDDASIKRLKGKERPIETLAIRMKKLAELSIVDYVISFFEDTPLSLIQQLKPTILVKGGDYTIENIVGHNLVEKVAIIPLLDGFSTTKIIENNKSN